MVPVSVLGQQTLRTTKALSPAGAGLTQNSSEQRSLTPFLSEHQLAMEVGPRAGVEAGAGVRIGVRTGAGSGPEAGVGPGDELGLEQGPDGAGGGVRVGAGPDPCPLAHFVFTAVLLSTLSVSLSCYSNTP